MSRESSAPKINPPSPTAHTINVSAYAIGYSEAFVLGPMLARLCQRCFCLVLDGMTMPHDMWHDGRLP